MMRVSSAFTRTLSVGVVMAGLVAIAPAASVGALPPLLLESCSVDWVDVDDGDDSKEITVTIAASASEFAVVLDTRFRDLVPVDSLGRTTAGATTYFKRYHDNDWDYLSVRPIDGGVKGEWVVCGNTSIFGPDLPAPVERSSFCEVQDATASMTGAHQGVTIETRNGDGEWQVLRTESVPDSQQADTFDLAELGVQSASELRFVDIRWGYPLRSAQDPTPCVDGPAPVELPEVSCTSPNAYLGVRGQDILGFKVHVAPTTDPRVEFRDIRTRITGADGTSVTPTIERTTQSPDGSVDTTFEVKDIAPGTYTVEVRHIAQPVGDDSRPRTSWLPCGSETVPG